MARLTVFCDIDGVVADFVGGACRAHGWDNPWLVPNTPWTGEFELINIFGVSKEQFWRPIDDLGQTFWRTLETTPEANELYSLAHSFGDDVAFLTAPSDDPSCVPGKRSWIAGNFPKTPVIFAQASAKRLLAHPKALLIDDKDSNVEEFYKAGGHAILVPRPWNKLHKLDTLDYVRTEVAKLHALLQDASGTVRGTTVRTKTRAGEAYTVSVAPSSTDAAWKTARGDRRRVSSDDVTLLSCARCGGIFSSEYSHRCPHPGEAGPQC